MKRTVEIIVAIRNEADAVGWFVDGVTRLEIPSDFQIQVTFIEDGSTDQTVERLKALAKKHSWVRFYSLEKGFGQIPALVFGLNRSTADAQILMDVDGTHPLGVIPEMIRKFAAGAEVVQGHRKDSSRRSGIRKYAAYTFRWYVRVLTGVDLSKQTVYYRLIGPRYRERILANPRSIYFLRLRYPKTDPRVQYVDFQFEDRSLGQSKYPIPRLVRFAATGILSLLSETTVWGIVIASCLASALLSRVAGDAAWLFALPALWLEWKHWKMSRNTILSDMRICSEGEHDENSGFRAQKQNFA